MPTSRSIRVALIVGLVALCPASAEWPPEVKNLQHFPEEIEFSELIGSMRGFTFGLGVRCQYCHVGEEGQPLSEFDFASDEKETKRKARTMLAMVDAINGVHLLKLGEEDADRVRVQCVTCHRGASRPEQLVDILTDIAMADGGAAALARYDELREEFYGSHTYDFSEGTLVRVGDRLARAEKAEAAVALLERNVELFPESTWTLGTLAEVEARRGNTAAAIGVYERLLGIEPGNPRVQQRLEQLRSAPAEEDG